MKLFLEECIGATVAVFDCLLLINVVQLCDQIRASVRIHTIPRTQLWTELWLGPWFQV